MNEITLSELVSIDDVLALNLDAFGVEVDDLFDFTLLSEEDFEELFGMDHFSFEIMMYYIDYITVVIDFDNLEDDFDYSAYEWEYLDEDELPSDFDFGSLSDEAMDAIDWDAYFDREWQKEQEITFGPMAFYLGWQQILDANAGLENYFPQGDLAAKIEIVWDDEDHDHDEIEEVDDPTLLDSDDARLK